MRRYRLAETRRSRIQFLEGAGQFGRVKRSVSSGPRRRRGPVGRWGFNVMDTNIGHLNARWFNHGRVLARAVIGVVMSDKSFPDIASFAPSFRPCSRFQIAFPFLLCLPILTLNFTTSGASLIHVNSSRLFPLSFSD